MGWDCYADLPNDASVFGLPKRHPVARAFRAAAKYVRKRVGTVDCMLERGGLDVSTCAYAIQTMCPQVSAWADYSAKEVRFMAAQADAYELQKDDEPWAFESAKAFLITAAAHGCSYRASY